MLRLLLIRHGETKWNAQQRYQGQSDVRLSKRGIQQAGLLAKRLSREAVDAVYSSDLKRAWQTAQIVAKDRRMKVTAEPRLREMNFGILEGLTFGEAQSRFPEIINAWLENYNKPPPGGEDWDGFTERVLAVLEFLQAHHAEQTVLLVAHGGPLSELVRLALDLPMTHQWVFLMNNAALSEIHLTGGLPYIKFWNDTCHLTE